MAGPTTTSLGSSANPAVFGQPVSFIARVSPAPGGGTVRFTDGGTPVDGCSAVAVDVSGQAICNPSGLAVGAHDVVVSYGGYEGYRPSTSPTLVQTVARAATTTVLTAPSRVLFGHSVTLAATVSANPPGVGTPTGSVAFSDGQRLLDSVGLSGGEQNRATTTAMLLPGEHHLSADYAGDVDFAPSAGRLTVWVGCNTTIDGRVNGQVTVPSGEVLCVTSATVNGGIGVEAGGALVVTDSTINGSIRSSGATGLMICGSRIAGTLVATDTSGPVAVGGVTDADVACVADVVTGRVRGIGG